MWSCSGAVIYHKYISLSLYLHRQRRNTVRSRAGIIQLGRVYGVFGANIAPYCDFLHLGIWGFGAVPFKRKGCIFDLSSHTTRFVDRGKERELEARF